MEIIDNKIEVLPKPCASLQKKSRASKSLKKYMVTIKVNIVKYMFYGFLCFLSIFLLISFIVFIYIAVSILNIDVTSFNPTGKKWKALVMLVIGFTFLPLFCSVLFTGALAFALSMTTGNAVTSEGISYPSALGARQVIQWSEIDDIHNQWGYYILRKRLSAGISLNMEQANPTLWGEKICRLPKPFLIKNKDEVLEYLAKVMPPGNILQGLFLK